MAAFASPARKSRPSSIGIFITSNHPGDVLRKSQNTSDGVASATDTNDTTVSPLINGQMVKAAVSTPGVARRWSSACSQNASGCGRRAMVSRFTTRSAENPVG
jgi:hypothetical protein